MTVETPTLPPLQTGYALELRGLRRSFGGVAALAGLDLSVAPGELVCLLGPSGCGKTTALRIVAGLEHADEGSVRVGERDIAGVPANKRDMGMVFQNYSLFPNLDVLDNVAFGPRLRGVGTRERRRRAGELLDLVGLADQAGKYVHQLSGGQQQRVALARALAVEPTVLLLDEPLSALDAVVRVQLRDEIRALQTRLGITTLFVTHDQEEALCVSDRIAVMRDGRLEQVATPAEVYANPATAFVAGFIGTMNRLPGHAADGVATVLGRRLPIAGGDPSENGAAAEVDVLVRPEAVALTPDPDGDVRILISGFRGAFTRLTGELPDGTHVLCDVPSAQAADLPPGTRAALRITTESVMVEAR